MEPMRDFETRSDDGLDILTFELIRNALSEIADEMMTSLVRTGRSVNTTQALDCSAGLADADGQLLAQALALPGHMGTFPGVMRAVFDRFGSEFRPGDIYISNDPFSVGLHMPDIVLVRPIFQAKELAGFALAVAHHVDVGGMAAGGMPTYATEVYAEGLRIPLVRLYDQGRVNETLLEIIRSNVRVPDLVVGDLMGQVAACHVGQKRLEALIRDHGRVTFDQATTQLLDYAERMCRAAIAAWPDGSYSFEDVVDDDGNEAAAIAIRGTVTIDGDSLRIDFSDSDPQVKGSVNCPIHSTFAGALTAVQCVLGAAIPANAGLFRAISVTARPGTFVSPVEPAATCNRALTLARVADVVFGALAQAVPDRVPACSESMTSPMTWSTTTAEGERLVWVDNHISGRGGLPTMDAQEGIAPFVYNANNDSVEITEASFPLRLERFRLIPDSEGAGKFRGGLATERLYRVLAREATLTYRSDRHTSRPWGLAGGHPGRNSNVFVTAGDEVVQTPPKFTRAMHREDVLHSIMQSGGGWGNPLDRDPAAVLEDVLDEKIGRDRARDVYGVVISPVTSSVDTEATAALRAEMSR
ncbi:MAG: hydantoinase B/oxoprolinase family protein [Zavarzinia sp.]|nr:hydantoinase B/oxoprolinase family protein [Zavarzinia sp.]